MRWFSTNHNGTELAASNYIRLRKGLWISGDKMTHYKKTDGMTKIFNRAYDELISMEAEQELLR